MKSKKFICLILSVFVLLAFCACSNSQAQQNETTKSTESSVVSNTESETSATDTSRTVKNNNNTKSSTTEKSNEKTTTAKAVLSNTKANETTAKQKKKDDKTTVTKQTTITKKSNTCKISIECSTILKNLKDLDPGVKNQVPSNGIILPTQTVEFSNGDSAYDILQRVCKENKIQMEASWTGTYSSAYIEGIHNIYELDCGSGSGWMYCINGWYPNYGCSRYNVKNGDNIRFRYTCNYGKDIGGKIQ